MALKKPKISTRIKNFFMMNWWLTGVSNFIIIGLLIWGTITIKEVEKNTISRLNKTMKNVIFATPDGRVALIDKKTINTDSDVFINHIGQIVKLMLASESKLTQGFDTTVASMIDKPSVLLDVNEDFKLLYQEFFANDQITAIFLRYNYNMLKRGQLPKKLTILSTEKNYQPLPDGGFQLKVTLKVQKDFINKVSNKPVELITTDVVTVQGFIDPSAYSTPDNPFGVKFTSVKLNLFLYDNYFTRRQ